VNFADLCQDGRVAFTTTQGRLLVASPALSDGIFDRTVVLMLEHDGDEGALGLVLTTPSATRVSEVLPDWASLAAEPDVVFWGGPVGAGSAICLGLARPGTEPFPWQPVVSRLGVVDLQAGPEMVGGAVESLRVFSGYAGWSAGQLDDELDAGAWWVVDADALDAMDPAPGDLWRAVLRRQGVTLARYALYPPDASLN
jgi:putative transcriptional regulator